MSLRLHGIALSVGLWACGPGGTAPSADGGPDGSAPDAGTSPDAGTVQLLEPTVPDRVFAGLNTGADAHSDLCADDHLHPSFPDDADVFIRVFCADVKPGGVSPVPTSLVDLETLLGLDFKDPGGINGENGNPAFVVTAHSIALAGRFVSAANPRVIVFTPPPTDGSAPNDYVLLAFTRGDTFVEVAAHDPTLDTLVFYLVRFQPPCTGSGGGCTAADLLTPAIERGWSSVTSYTGAVGINDTVLDCLQCHQPGGTNTRPMLRMQELSAPYTHFMSAQTAGGRALLDDFHAVHGSSEDYGGVPAALIDQSDPAKLAAFVRQAGDATQPNAFDSAAIEAEVAAAAPQQPQVNVPAGSSATWAAINAVARTGKAIRVPYYDVKITDAATLGTAAAAYRSFLSGATPVSNLPDIRDVLLDSGLRDMGFGVTAGAAPDALLVEACQQCHNSSLDQTISRALFNVQILDMLPRTRKLLAVQRLTITDPNDPQMMPPPEIMRLSDDERQSLIQLLNN